jgi:quinol-cytochrome oxidoreductase complex cytochrome b subunit
MLLAILGRAFLHWLDTFKVRSMRYRLASRPLRSMFAAAFLGLGYLGSMPAEGSYGSPHESSRHLVSVTLVLFLWSDSLKAHCRCPC